MSNPNKDHVIDVSVICCFLEKGKNIAPKALEIPNRKVKSVASRAFSKSQKHMKKVGSRAYWNHPVKENGLSLATRACRN